MPFVGALRWAPAHILRTNNPYEPKAMDDLVMVVQVLLQVMCHALNHSRPIFRGEDATVLEGSEVWRALHKAAKRTDYSKIQY